MKPEEIIGLSIFGLLVLAALVVAIRQGRKHRRQMAMYSSAHGCTVLEPRDAHLKVLLEEMDPDSNWTPDCAILVESSPHRVYLFKYQVSSRRGGHSSPSYGFACLAERSAPRPEWPVTIFNRVPLLEKFVGNRVEAGGDEFRRAYTVTCPDAGVAVVTVNLDVECILLDHASGQSWGLTVTLTREGVLVQSSWAQSEQQWDQLTGITKKLLAAFG